MVSFQLRWQKLVSLYNFSFSKLFSILVVYASSFTSKNECRTNAETQCPNAAHCNNDIIRITPNVLEEEFQCHIFRSRSNNDPIYVAKSSNNLLKHIYNIRNDNDNNLVY
jgi:hypothetical protein